MDKFIPNLNIGRFHFISLILCCHCLIGCFSLSPKPDNPPQISKKESYENDDAFLQRIQGLLERKEYLSASNDIYQFLKVYPTSQHWYGILFAYGRAKEGIEDWSGALSVYKQIVERSTERQMEFVALAFYRMAYCYEVLLNNEKALAALQDASQLSSYLPLEISEAEIPARIASVYARMNQPVLADKFTQRAEKGISQVRAVKKNADPEWLSRTLIKMGGISLTQIDPESFQQNIFTLIRNQRYLIQAIELNHSNWAPDAERILINTYTNLWGFIENFQLPSSQDWEADLVNQAKMKADFISLFLEAIEKLKTFEAPEETTNFILTAKTYHQVKMLEQKATALLEQELLKRPWTPGIKKKILPPLPSLKSSEAFNDSNLEFDKQDSRHPSTLPKKKLHKGVN